MGIGNRERAPCAGSLCMQAGQCPSLPIVLPRRVAGPCSKLCCRSAGPQALTEMNGHFLSNRPIRVSLATAKKNANTTTASAVQVRPLRLLRTRCARCAHAPSAHPLRARPLQQRGSSRQSLQSSLSTGGAGGASGARFSFLPLACRFASCSWQLRHGLQLRRAPEPRAGTLAGRPGA